MISQLSGVVVSVSGNVLVLDVHGVGYKVSATPATLTSLHEGTKTSLLTHLVVREDALDLYGFTSEIERTVFHLLLSVSGIGPKSALSILSLAGVKTIVTAVNDSKASYLTALSGIGKKTAEKIVIELKTSKSGFEYWRIRHIAFVR